LHTGFKEIKNVTKLKMEAQSKQTGWTTMRSYETGGEVSECGLLISSRSSLGMCHVAENYCHCCKEDFTW
jgi:hypothetical protein